MTIRSAEFKCSSPRVEQCPVPDRPEIAFIGRSNVGKSSLINRLTHRRDLAKVSSTPGKTQMINHFDINNGEWYLVDLPGYGFAKVGDSKRAKFAKMIEGYLLQRENLHIVFVLVDIRHEPQKKDLDFIRFLGENGIPLGIIFTKSDKLSPTRARENVERYKQVLLEEWEELPPIFVTSSEKGDGREELLNYIGQTLQQA